MTTSIRTQKASPPSKRKRETVTQKQIAEYLNISQQTVSAAFTNNSGTAKVSEKTRRMVLKTARKLGHVPNLLARSLRSGKTRSIGIIMPYCNDPYFSAIIDAFSHEALKREHSIALQFHLWSEEEERAAIERLLASKVDGIFIFPRLGSYTEDILPAISADNRPPFVALASVADSTFFKGVLSKDDDQEGYLLATTLIAAGHRSIDLLSIDLSHPAQKRKMQGIRRAIAESGQEVTARHASLPKSKRMEMELVPAPLIAVSGVLSRLVEHYLSRKSRASSVIVGNEIMASALIFSALRLGLSVPQDFSVVCCAVSGGNQIGIPVTSVEYDAAEIARLSFELLFKEDLSRATIVPRLAFGRTIAPPPQNI